MSENDTNSRYEHPDRCYVEACHDSLSISDWQPNRQVWADLCEIAMRLTDPIDGKPAIRIIVNATIQRCADAARDALVAHEWPPQDGDVQADEVINAILALATPATSA